MVEEVLAGFTGHVGLDLKSNLQSTMFWQNGGFDRFDGLVDMDFGLREMYKNPTLLTT